MQFVDQVRGAKAGTAGQGVGVGEGMSRVWGDGPDEAAAVIAESAAELVGLARRHKLEMLGFLLSMAQLEAEKQLRLRTRQNLS